MHKTTLINSSNATKDDVYIQTKGALDKLKQTFAIDIAHNELNENELIKIAKGNRIYPKNEHTRLIAKLCNMIAIETWMWSYSILYKKIAIVGSRNFNQLWYIDYIFDLILDHTKDITIVSGGAKGVDITAEKAAKRVNYKTDIYLPDWDKYGKGAGIIRNTHIITASDAVIAFWDRKSKGTKHSINLAKEQNKPTIICGIELFDFM